MRHDLHALGTSHTRVSGDRVKPDKWMNNRQEAPTKALDDLLYDVTVLFNDVTSENKMMHFGRGASEV